MSTPTPMKHAPSQQGRTPSQSQHGAVATPGVSTPFSQVHAAFSPSGGGPRSSPQTIRRSPATSVTLMGHSSNAPVNFDSPSAAAALGALGIGGGLDLSLDGVGVGGLSGLGGLGRGDDDERARRLKAVQDILKLNKGRVSEAGLERLAQTTGLECLWEEGKGSDKTRTLIIAGSALALEVVFINNIVQAVNLTYPESSDIVMRHVDRAGEILYNDLKLLPHESPLTKKMDRFAANLESLAVLDRLSVLPHLNLHEAVAGIFESLNRLYKWDLEKLREDPASSGKSEEALEVTALCARHGMPVMHARDRLGLSLQYWKEKHHCPPRSEHTKELARSEERTWHILIECAPSGELVYPSVRVSENWLAPEIELPSGEQDLLSATAEPLLNWQEPDNTFLQPSEDEVKGENGSQPQNAALTGPKLPEVIFTAKLDPPVTVTYSVGINLYQLIGLTPANEYNLVTFDALNFPIEPGSNHDPSEPRMISCRKEVQVMGRGPNATTTTSTHKNTLFVYKPVYGKTLEELPFSHPNQLIRMLPTLRQYAFLATLLEKSFDTRVQEIFLAPPPETTPKEAKPRKEEEVVTVDTLTAKDQFAAFMEHTPAGGADDSNDDDHSPDHMQVDDRNGDGDGDGGAAEAGAQLSIDVVLTAHPVPRLQVVFPLRGGVTADVMLEIRLNGLVHVVAQNILPDDEEEGGALADRGRGGPRLEPQDLGRLLEVCEDLGQWCEWIRTRLG